MRIPIATYRVQMGPGFGFRRLMEILDYLTELGISDIYASPVFRARPGSSHGYDVVDPNGFNPELGTGDEWEELTRRRRSLGLGWLQDIVPNHMAFNARNSQICGILEQGPRADAADFFDIDWRHPQPELNGRVSAPFLGADLDQCLDRGEIRLGYDASGLFISYYTHRFPLALKTYPLVFGGGRDTGHGDDHPPVVNEWLRGIWSLAESGPDRRRIIALKAQMWDRFTRSEEIRGFIDRQLGALNAPGNRTVLGRLLRRQYFHLNFWQNAARCINYRRFFSINELIAVRQESRRVFDRTHALAGRLARSGVFSGLRVDHVDGLLAPGLYLDRLSRACGDAYLLVEKITAAHESPPLEWPIQGTTGYDFAVHLDRLFTFSGSESRLDEICADFCGPRPGFETMVRECKADLLRNSFGGDLDNVTARFRSLPEFKADPPPELDAAVARLLINMPVYRTYLSDGSRCAADAQIFGAAVSAAVEQRADLEKDLRRLERVMTSGAVSFRRRPITGKDSFTIAVGAFEQLCAALTAKGVEDTALYRYNRLLAHNEVGAEPQRFGETRRAFHDFAGERRRRSHTLNALSTHDSKRCGDVRARLLVLTEMPEAWADRVNTWRRMNRRHYRAGKNGRLPDPAAEYFLYQTLVGTCPGRTAGWDEYIRRIASYMTKAAREAKVFTNWDAPDQEYEAGLTAFVHRILALEDGGPFVADLLAFAGRAAAFGRINTIAQTLIQLTVPGVPDIYQGTELFDDSLVDPDNRRPVDYEKRRRRLADIRKAYDQRTPRKLAAAFPLDGDPDRVKLYVIHAGLQARRRRPELFATGDYVPLELRGRRSYHGVAFARILDGDWYVTAVPRFLSKIASPEALASREDIWQGTGVTLPADAPRRWRDELAGGSVRVYDGVLALQTLFSVFPGALLKAEV